MDAVLSVQGASAPVKKKSFFSKFTRLNMLRLARAVIPAAVLMMFFPQLAMAAGSSGQDLMASGNTTVKATFGKDSSVVKWVVLAEVLVGAVMYMMTKTSSSWPVLPSSLYLLLWVWPSLASDRK